MATVIIDPAKGWPDDGSIALLEATKLDKDAGQFLTLRGDAFRNKVTLIVYRDAAKAGSFGEECVLTFFDSEFQRFALLGTEEADIALKEFVEIKARSKRRKMGVDDEELFGGDELGIA